MKGNQGKDIVIEPIRDDDFYFDDVIFLVEDYLFKIPRREFEANSEVFRQMFALPPIGVPDGLSDQQPLRLSGIHKVDFQAFLQALYPKCAYQGLTLSIPEWKSVLKLATMWDFSGLREIAVAELKRQLVDNPVERVALSKKYNLDDWLVPALNELAQREQPITFEEGEIMGFDTALKVAAVRESCASCHCGSPFEWCYKCDKRKTDFGVRRGARTSLDFIPKISVIFDLPRTPPKPKDA